MKKLYPSGFNVAPLAMAVAMTLPASVPAFAQDSSAFMLEEIVVTARRKFESLQDVPQTVNAVGADTFEKLNILNFEDMESVVAGVSLDTESNGYSTAASMRGISFDISSQTAPSVEFYLNDAPVESNQIFTQVFDIGQVEVLRGPQGTLRGRSAPSGAITVRTREANLSELDGYLNATATNKGGTNYQGAVNIPLIQDKVALRLAGVIDENDLGGIESIFDDRDADSDIKGLRATLGFAPTDNFEGSLMYQRMTKDQVSYTQVAGSNEASDGGSAGYIPHHSGISIDPEDRLALGTANIVANVLEVTTLNLSWILAGQEISYVGQYGESQVDATSPSDSINTIGSAAFFGVDEWNQDLDLYQEQESHEIRFSPEEPIADMFSYTAGLFYQTKDGINFLNTNTVLSSANSPFLPDPNATFGAIVNATEIERPSNTEEVSAFLNGTVFLSESTEVSAGVRHIHTRQYDNTLISGFSIAENKRSDDELIWNLAMSHRFNETLMMYANVGTAVRPGPLGSLGVSPQPNPSPDMQRALVRDQERSTSYELGVKWDFMDGRGRLNAAYYFQDFDGYLYFAPLTQYYAYDRRSMTSSVDDLNPTVNADAEVQGLDIDASFQVLPNWNVSGVLAWNDSELLSDVPCNEGPALDEINQINFCDTGDKAGTGPDWNASIRSEYFTDVSDKVEGYVRGIYTYTPENDNQHKLTTIDSYGLLNLFVGVRDNAGAWDVQLFAKNIFDEFEVTSYEDLEVGEGGTLANFYGSGYHNVLVTPRREVGVSLRYNFGAN